MAIPLTRVLPLTGLICVVGGLPAAIIAPQLRGAQTESSYLLVTAGLLAVAAGITVLVSWRIIGHALAGWLGTALVAWGVLTLTESALSGDGAGSAPMPFGQLVGTLAVAFLVWRGLRDAKVNAGFSPLVALTTTVGAGFVTLIALRLLESAGTLSARSTGSPAQTVADAVGSLVWFSLAGATVRRHRHSAVSNWVPLFAFLVGLGPGLQAIDPRAIGAGPAAALTFLGMAVALGGALVRVHGLLQGEDRRQLQLHDALRDTRQRASVDRSQLEEWLHDLRNVVAGLCAADAVLQAGDEEDRAARAALSAAVSGELTRLQTLVQPALSVQIAPVTLRDVLAPVVAAERALGAAISLSGITAAVLADRQALTRVVQNVLVNARTYGGHGRIVVRAHRLGPVFELSISDPGPGIPADERLAVFERGHRGAASAGTDGTGLGLYVARRLMAAMGGTIAVADDSPGCRMVLTLRAAAQELSLVDPTTTPRGGTEEGAAQLRPAS